MAPPQHKIDATLQAMERAHRSTPDEQVKAFSGSIDIARRDFERFATAEESAANVNQDNPSSLYALVEAEREVDRGFDRALEQVKESLAEMERKRMLALGSLTRLSPEEALLEVRKVKEHILSLSLRVPIRADFIVHGHNISLSLFKLFEAAERAEGEVDALINAKRSLDGGTPPPEATMRAPLSNDPQPRASNPLSPQASAQSSAEEHSPSPQTTSLHSVEGQAPPSEPRRSSTTSMRLKQALKRSSATATPSPSRFEQPESNPAVIALQTEGSSDEVSREDEVFQGGDEEYDL
jgi:hypothetical protein